MRITERRAEPLEKNDGGADAFLFVDGQAAPPSLELGCELDLPFHSTIYNVYGT
jgi:hypothetical protein